MATYTKTFSWLSTAEGWVGHNGTSCTSGVDTVGNPADSLYCAISGRAKGPSVTYWDWSGTWLDLGLPAGAVVTAIRVNAGYSRCTVYNTGASSTIGPIQLRDSGDTTVLATLWAGRTVTAVDGSWVALSGSDQSVPSGQRPAASTIKLRLETTLSTGASSSAAVRVNYDEVSFVVTYTVPVVVNPTPGTAGASAPAPSIDEFARPSAATAAASAPAPTVRMLLRVMPSHATAGAAAPVPTIRESVNALAASASADALAPALSETARPTPGSATASGPTPGVKWTVQASAATCSADAPAPTVSMGGGGGTSISDAFNRANSLNLGSDWTVIAIPSPVISLRIVSNACTGALSSAGGNVWTANTFANDQYAEVRVAGTDRTGANGNGPFVRGNATDGKRYWVSSVLGNDGLDDYQYIDLYRVGADGTMTHLGSQFTLWSPVMTPVIRIEAEGTAIRVKLGTAHGGTFTTIISVTDSVITSGSPGLWNRDSGTAVTWDDFYGGDIGGGAPAPIVVNAPAATASAAAPAPTLKRIARPTAGTATAQAPAPTLKRVVRPTAATATAQGPTPTLKRIARPTAGTATAQGPIPGIRLRVQAGVGGASAATPTPTLRLRAIAAPATATAQAPAPTVSFGGAPLVVNPPPAQASAQGPSPKVVWTPRPTAGAASATGPAPKLRWTVHETVANASAAGVAPTLRWIAKPAHGTATAQAPAPRLGRGVSVPPATATAQAAVPTIRWMPMPAHATATAQAPAPTLGMLKRVVVPAGTATAFAPAPGVLWIVRSDVGSATAEAPLPTVWIGSGITSVTGWTMRFKSTVATIAWMGDVRVKMRAVARVESRLRVILAEGVTMGVEPEA